MTQQGFWRENTMDNRRLMFVDKARVNNVFYLFPQGGGPRGSFSTFTDLAPQLQSRDLVLFSGVLKEQATCPVGVYDVTIQGASNRLRQATNGGVPTGGGSSWLSPDSPVAATPLLQVIEQGWTISNIQFAPPAGSPCVRFRRRESATIPDASHGQVLGCYFSTGGAAGVGIDVTETKRIKIADCEFEAIGTGACITNTADGGIATNNYHHIVGNRFMRGNALEIDLATNDSLIEGNIFYALFGVEGGFRIDLSGGARNRVLNNYFSDATAQYAVAGGYRTGAATDRWRNWVGDANDQVVANPA
jgi:hypothetical protein